MDFMSINKYSLALYMYMYMYMYMYAEEFCNGSNGQENIVGFSGTLFSYCKQNCCVYAG